MSHAELQSCRGLRPRQLADFWQVNLHHIYRLIREGALEAVNVSSNPNAQRPTLIITHESIDAFEQSRRTRPPKKTNRKSKRSARSYY